MGAVVRTNTSNKSLLHKINSRQSRETVTHKEQQRQQNTTKIIEKQQKMNIKVIKHHNKKTAMKDGGGQEEHGSVEVMSQGEDSMSRQVRST